MAKKVVSVFSKSQQENASVHFPKCQTNPLKPNVGVHLTAYVQYLHCNCSKIGLLVLAHCRIHAYLNLSLWRSWRQWLIRDMSYSSSHFTLNEETEPTVKALTEGRTWFGQSITHLSVTLYPEKPWGPESRDTTSRFHTSTCCHEWTQTDSSKDPPVVAPEALPLQSTLITDRECPTLTYPKSTGQS